MLESIIVAVIKAAGVVLAAWVANRHKKKKD